MVVIGLTGGIGTGKSEVSRILKGLGAVIIDADKIGHQVYAPHSQVWQEVVEAFGEQVLQPDGQIDRKVLGAIVFDDPQARSRLNSIMHPRMAEIIRQRIQQLTSEGSKTVVLEAALLIEAGWDRMVDEVWATNAPEDIVVQRVSQRNRLSEAEVRRRIGSQMAPAERLKRAHVVLDNTAGLKELESQVVHLWNSRVIGRID